MLLSLPGGHVGAVVSRSAQKSLWPKMSAFWASRDADVKMRINEGAHAEVTAQVRVNGDANGHAVVPAAPSAPAPISKPRALAKKAARNKTSSRSGGR